MFSVPSDARSEEINHEHINVQITAIVRNLLDVGQTVRDQIVEQRLLFAFNQMMNMSLDDRESNLNIARILR